MKYFSILPVIVMTLLFSTCKKKECCNFQVVPDFILAQKNKTHWEADPSASNILGDTITVSGKNTVTGEDELMGFKIVFDGIGFYTLKAEENFYRISKAGTLSGQYKPDPRYLSSVTIISYNQRDKILQGFFELRFLRVSDKATGNHPDTVSLSDGKFKVKLKY